MISNFISFSRSLEQFFLTVGQNNFGDQSSTNYLDLKLMYLKRFLTGTVLVLVLTFASICIMYCLSWLRQASQRKIIQISALILKLWLSQLKMSLGNPAFRYKCLVTILLGNLVFGRRNLWIFPNFHINAFVVEPPLAIWVICAGRKKKTYRKAIIGLIKFASFVPFGAER